MVKKFEVNNEKEIQLGDKIKLVISRVTINDKRRGKVFTVNFKKVIHGQNGDVIKNSLSIPLEKSVITEITEYLKNIKIPKPQYNKAQEELREIEQTHPEAWKVIQQLLQKQV